jgi:hypothetical protein
MSFLLRPVPLWFRLFFLTAGVLPVAAQTWETVALPANPTAKEVSQYVRDIRKAVRKTPINGGKNTVRMASDGRLDRATADKVKQAILRIPPSYLSVILDECEKADEAAAEEVKTQSQEFAGAVSAFTKVAISALAEMPDIPPDQQAVVFQRWSKFPNLVTVAAAHPWAEAAEPHLSVKLMIALDGWNWGGAGEAWIAYLLQLDSPRAWEAIDCMLTKLSRPIGEEAYWRIIRSGQTPRIDLAAAVRKSWERFALQPGHQSYARVAAHSGITEALVFMADEVRGPHRRVATFLFKQRLPSLLEPTFDDLDQAADFVRANKKNLVFDEARRKYRLKDE